MTKILPTFYLDPMNQTLFHSTNNIYKITLHSDLLFSISVPSKVWLWLVGMRFQRDRKRNFERAS